MGFWDVILRRDPYPVEVFTPRVEYLGTNEEIRDYYATGGASLIGATPAALWRQQPHLRTVVSFLARNVAQLGVHTFERVSETDRRRSRDSNIAHALSQPDIDTTTFEAVFALVGDLCLYDRAYWLVTPSADTPSGWMLRRLPPAWVTPVSTDLFTVKSYRVAPAADKAIEVPASQVLAFTGYNPTSLHKGSPTIETLRDTLQEQVESAIYRQQVWKRGGRVSSVLERPKDAPKWSDKAREAFREDWYSKYTGSGSKAGGTPILEDGMTLTRVDFSAQDQQYVEAAKLSLVTVAAAFHVNPTMIGQNDGANYSNVREFRRMLYGDTLGPLLAQIESRINTFLLPMLGDDRSRLYVEFNIAEKLQGSFEEQAAALSSAIGRPHMTANEGRARMNLPALGGDADQLVTPLNVLVGGQASPQDSGSQNRNSRQSVQVKGRAPRRFEDKTAEVVGKFFTRQERVVRTALGAKSAPDWWDEERWDGELADDLYRIAVMVAGQVAANMLRDIGFEPDQYDEDRTLAWLREVSSRSAASINATTRERIQEALDAEDPGESLNQVFAAQNARAGQIAVGTVTTLSGFASTEAARQVAGDQATKTWVAGKNPRSEHAALDGETVALSENFSNGAAWPGDGSALGAEDLAGCNCELQITVA